MLAELGNDLKKILLVGVGAVAVTAEKSEEVIKELVKKGELTVEQGKALSEDLKHKIEESIKNKKASRCVTDSDEVDVENMPPEERERLKRKLEEAEKAAGQEASESSTGTEQAEAEDTQQP